MAIIDRESKEAKGSQ